ncbi:hypothetical protein AK812_SmicGene34868 [Symbiodinium microadriaticum]|uniref:Uncharacterized protein n=1 Tax=Symbiodinium microadriaticum TaxID=2951 RepID=A0A1Q9CMX3_SYMMI|nr:hypothetical protein AK812_SmicGene34868 [Symbiodinium microadriaticum]
MKSKLQVSVQEARSQADAIREMVHGTQAVVSATAVHCKKNKTAVAFKEPQIRGKSALLCFRDDFLENQRQILAGSVVNPCSKEFWADLKQAWADMPSAKQAYYEELSSQSLQKAALDRNAKKQKQAETVTSTEVSLPATAQVESSGAMLPPVTLPVHVTQQLANAVPYNPWTLAAAAAGCASITEVADGIRKYLLNPRSSSDLNLQDEFLSCCPVAEDQLQSNWQFNVQNGVTWAQALNHFNIQAQRFSIPPSDDKFPDRVTYQSCCGCFCRTNASPQDLFLFSKLLGSFEDVIKQCGNGSAPSAASCDILLRFSFFAEDDELPRQDMYAWMTAMTARSGPHNCTQNFILMSVALDSSPDCLKLRLHSQAAIGQQVKWCSNLLQSGPLCHFSEQEFAKRLLEIFHECRASAVVITRLAFQDLDLCTVVVEGSWDSWEDLTVRFAGQQAAGEEDEQAIDVPQAVADDGLPESADQPDQGNHFDLLAEISEGGGVQKRGKGKGRGRGRGTSSELRRGLVAALPFDPTIQQELQREFQQFLADEHVQPEIVLPDRPGCSDIERTLRDPAIAASLDAETTESVLEAVATCRQANPDLEACFAESDDGEIVEDTVDPGQEPPDPPEAGGIGSVGLSDDEAVDAGAADDGSVPCFWIIISNVLSVFRL